MMRFKYAFEYVKSSTLAPISRSYKSVVKGNRRLRIIPECLDTQSLFVHIPKTGGHSVGMSLYQRDPWHYRYRDYATYAAQNNIDLDQFYKFAIVRHPVDRMISMYSYLQDLKYVDSTLIPLKLAPDIVSFVDEWLKASKNAKGLPISPFLYSQKEYVCGEGDKIALDHIVRLEDISKEFPIIAMRTKRPRASLLHVNKSVKPASLFDSDKREIMKLMADEISFFNY